MRFIIGFLLLFALVPSCRDKIQRGEIKIAEYTFYFPNDFKLIEGKGIDSYVGRIKGDSLSLSFDYGDYSNTLVETTEEYLATSHWKQDAKIYFVAYNNTYDLADIITIKLLQTNKISRAGDFIKFKGADLIATCEVDSIKFKYPIFFPDKMKNHIVKVDTIENHFRKIVIAKNPKKGITGMYIRDLNGFDKSINNYLALSMGTRNISKEQHDSILKIFLNMKISYAE